MFFYDLWIAMLRFRVGVTCRIHKKNRHDLYIIRLGVILWNAVTSLGEKNLYKTPPPYFIVLASSVKTNEVKVIEFRRIASKMAASLSADVLYLHLSKSISYMSDSHRDMSVIFKYLSILINDLR